MVVPGPRSFSATLRARNIRRSNSSSVRSAGASMRACSIFGNDSLARRERTAGWIGTGR